MQVWRGGCQQSAPLVSQAALIGTALPPAGDWDRQGRHKHSWWHRLFCQAQRCHLRVIKAKKEGKGTSFATGCFASCECVCQSYERGFCYKNERSSTKTVTDPRTAPGGKHGREKGAGEWLEHGMGDTERNAVPLADRLVKHMHSAAVGQIIAEHWSKSHHLRWC